MEDRKARKLLAAYALLNALLYSVLTPLWEGFDEPFHFGYVQQLANGEGLPDPRTSRLSGETGTSLLLAPASAAVQKNLPQLTAYSEYFAWPAALRQEARRRLWTIPAALRWHPSQFVNYEGHHPPLAYALLAVPEGLMAEVPLPLRVAILRMLAAAAGSLLLLSGAGQVFSQLKIDGAFRTAALFCLLSCQMIWATLAHIGNDWLAVPIAVWCLAALNHLGTARGRGNAALAAAVLAAGLLTKAYFLAFAPLLVLLCLQRRRWQPLAIASLIVLGLAGPWYARNLGKYGDLSATQESRGGVTVGAAMRAAPAMNWRVVIPASIRTSLWTGNNSGGTFSRNTLNVLIAAGMLALLMWAASRHAGPEWITAAFCGLFLLALGYAAAASHVFTHGAAMAPSPWYAQTIAAPLLGLAFLGASRWNRPGKLVAILLVALFGYVLAVTYVVKLIPLYGGFEGRTSLQAVAALYAHRFEMLRANLDSTALAGSSLIITLAALTIAVSIRQQIASIREILAHNRVWMHLEIPAQLSDAQRMQRSRTHSYSVRESTDM
jgi:hypothetical protein